MVVERLPFQPPGFAGAEWYAPLLRAALRWQEAARRVSVPPLHAIDGRWFTDWMRPALKSLATLETRRLSERFDDDWTWVTSVCDPAEPAHGDVHFFNAGAREPGIPESLVLFDPIPRVAPWPFDAANCETLTNYRAGVPDGEPLVLIAARDRRERGLPTPDDAGVRKLSALFCAWLSLMWLGIFNETQPERRKSAAAYVEQALACA